MRDCGRKRQSRRPALLPVACCLLPFFSALGGCASTASIHAPQDAVWRAVVAESIAWQPTRIDEKTRTVEIRRTDPTTGQELDCLIEVTPDANPFAPAPSTTVTVSFEQLAPTRKRFSDLEGQFLQRIRSAFGGQ